MANICDMCGDACKPVEHHLVFGTGMRKLAEEDGLKLNLCIDCHTMAFNVTERIHDNVAAERLSKMLGQMMFERNYIAFYSNDEEIKEKARDAFRRRYGRNYL